MKKIILIINIILCLTVLFISHHHFHRQQQKAAAYHHVLLTVSEKYDLNEDRLERKQVEYIPEEKLYAIQIEVKKTGNLLAYKVGVNEDYAVTHFEEIINEQSE